MKDVDQQRRDLLKALLRVGALAGLAGAAIALLMRRNATCPHSSACNACDRFSRCGLPQALEHRNRAGAGAP